MLPYIHPSAYGAPDRIKTLAHGLNVQPLADALAAHPEVWDRDTARTAPADSAHHGLSDVWCRFAPPGGSGQTEHLSVWYPAADLLPVRMMARELMALFGAEQLGGVLITRIPPGAECRPHVDAAWHAGFYDKFAVQVAAAPGQAFHFEGEAKETVPGELYWFRNDVLHWVTNDSDQDRITAIFCLRIDRTGSAS